MAGKAERLVEIDTYYTSEIVCPWCGYEYQDSWAFEPSATARGEQCQNCEQTFWWETDIEVTYTSRKSYD